MSKIRVAAGLISSEAFLFASQTAHCLGITRPESWHGLQRGSLDSQHWHSGLVISGWVLRSLPADWYSIWHKVGSNGY